MSVKLIMLCMERGAGKGGGLGRTEVEAARSGQKGGVESLEFPTRVLPGKNDEAKGARQLARVTLTP